MCYTSGAHTDSNTFEACGANFGSGSTGRADSQWESLARFIRDSSRLTTSGKFPSIDSSSSQATSRRERTVSISAFCLLSRHSGISSSPLC